MRIGLTCLLLGLSLAAPGGTAAAEAAPLKRLSTAHEMFRIGLADQDPLLILAAARLRKGIAATPVERAPEGGAAVAGTPLDWPDMLAAAGPMIAGNPLLEGLAEDIAAERAKGVTSGPVYSIVEIGAGGSDRYPGLPFSGGHYAEVYVEGPSGTDMNILVHDAQGRLVCSDTDISAIAYCGWKPATGGSFTITVENSGPRAGRYSMMTN